MGTEVAVARERLTERELQILDHLEQAQGLDVPLTEHASAYGLDVKYKFHWPHRFDTESVTLTGEQLNWLLDGYDVWRMKPHDALNLLFTN
jgi:hypothetical protein